MGRNQLLAPLLAALIAAPASADRGSDRALVAQTLTALDRGDQEAYEQFAASRFSRSALDKESAATRASSLARLYTDTGGVVLDRIVGSSKHWIQAEGIDRMSGTRQCLTLRVTRTPKAILLDDIAASALYEAGPSLMPPTTEEIVERLSGTADRFAARGLMSGVMLIAQGDEIRFERAYGYASLAHQTPMTVTTRLNTASIAKMFTGAAIARLVAEGRLSYDDTVGKHLTDLSSERIRNDVTIRQLLTHTAGLGPLDYYEKDEWNAAKPLLRDVPSWLDLVQREKIDVDAPSGQYLYSNAGYVILGKIIERVTGDDFYRHIARDVFGPAGMSRSFYAETDAEAPDVAEPTTNLFNIGLNNYIYRLGTPRRAIYELAARGGPQGGATVTARDLFLFIKALRSGQLVRPDLLQEMLTAQSPAGAGASSLGGSVREGLGVEVAVMNGHRFHGHTGGDIGIASSAYWYPESGYTIIILTNRDPRAARVLTGLARTMINRQTVGGAPIPPQRCTPPVS